MEKYAGGVSFLTGVEPLEAVPPGSSGSFFPVVNKKGVEDKQFSSNSPEASSQSNSIGINQQLDEKVVRALLRIHPKDRADIKVVHQTVKEMADEYLTQEVRETAISLLQQMNHSPIRDFMQDERNTVNSFVNQGNRSKILTQK